jgi:uncharacterized membrane protein YcaP (DUF421 family)
LRKGIGAFTVLVALQFAITWTAVRVAFVQRLVKSTPAVLVIGGEFEHDMLRRERVAKRRS